jgi:hypothetical protein
VCVCVRACRVRTVTAATAVYYDAEPEVSARQRLYVCGETDHDAEGEDPSESACAGADAAIWVV